MQIAADTLHPRTQIGF